MPRRYCCCVASVEWGLFLLEPTFSDRLLDIFHTVQRCHLICLWGISGSKPSLETEQSLPQPNPRLKHNKNFKRRYHRCDCRLMTNITVSKALQAIPATLSLIVAGSYSSPTAGSCFCPPFSDLTGQPLCWTHLLPHSGLRPTSRELGQRLGVHSSGHVGATLHVYSHPENSAPFLSLACLFNTVFPLGVFFIPKQPA